MLRSHSGLRRRALMSIGWLMITLGSVACGDDDGNGGPGGASGAGAGGAAGGAGTAATPDAGPPAATTCEVEKVDDCAECLAGACCSDLQYCMGEASCREPFLIYRECADSGTHASDCFGVMAATLRGDGSVSEADGALLSCILVSCGECGTPSAI